MDTQHIDFLQLFNSQVQYVVPRWQRRYCWGESDIKRLVEDLIAVAQSTRNVAHFGGTLITFPENRAPGPVPVYRVVDGQQRLTTISIILACIAKRLGTDDKCGEWTAEMIRNDRLFNPGKPPEKRRKLRLQDGDEEEYRSGLEDGEVRGPGAVSQAWRIIRRLVKLNDVELLFKGLERFRVVSIGLKGHDDPQQIFETLNATGRPLTEGEKLKNWLLMALDDDEQQEVYDLYWKRIERSLGARNSPERIDTFLRDVLRWQTGEMRGVKYAYSDLRRWALRTERDRDRKELSSWLATLAVLYGTITGTGTAHRSKSVERALVHLRAMRMDTHRPLTLRLLHEADGSACGWTNDELAKVLSGVGTWMTRFWLSDRPSAGLNKAFTELAHWKGPGAPCDLVKEWFGRIRKFRNTRAGVPGDEAVREGIRARKAYGGKATDATKAILSYMMEDEQDGDSPAREGLTIEHIMPRKLTEAWKEELGPDAEQVHNEYCNLLANLTLSGVNAKLGAKSFEDKKVIMNRSGILLNRDIATESRWDQDAMDRRAKTLAARALKLWPWDDGDSTAAAFRWRLDEGPWHSESNGRQMVINVVSALLDRDPSNADHLLGPRISADLQWAGELPLEGGKLLIPKHRDYVINTNFTQDRNAARAKDMAKKCGVRLDVRRADSFGLFWDRFREQTGDRYGPPEGHSQSYMWTKYPNKFGDKVGISLTGPSIRVYLKGAQGTRDSLDRIKRMASFSRSIQVHMADQSFSGEIQTEASEGRSVCVVRSPWDINETDEWTGDVLWIKDQIDRLTQIAST